MFTSKERFPFHKQYDRMDCGPAALKMIAQHFGKEVDFEWIKQHCYLTKQGVSFSGMIAAADKMGMETMPIKVPFEDLYKKVTLPCIAHWNANHFVVIFKISKNIVHVADPKHGIVQYNFDEFKTGWANQNSKEGVLLLIEPGKGFYKEQRVAKKRNDLRFLKTYFRPYNICFIDTQILLT